MAAAKRFTLWDLKKKTPKQKKVVQSPKKPKLIDLFEENNANAVKVCEARSTLASVNDNVEHLKPDDIFLFLVSKIGFENTSHLMKCQSHVPDNFPRREKYIQDIMGNACTKREIDIIKGCFQNRQPRDRQFNKTDYNFTNKLWECSFSNSAPYLCFLSPRVDSCLECYGKLGERSVCKVTLYTMSGPVPGLRTTLRCTKCAITYEMDRYHHDGCESKLYDSSLQQDLVSASGKVYFTQDVFELQCELGNHAFVSAQAFAETYNSVFHNEHPNVKKFTEWQKQMERKLNNGSTIDLDAGFEDYSDIQQDTDDHKDDFETALTAHEVKASGCQILLTRKNTMNAFLNGELISELQERNLVETIQIGRKHTREDAMKAIDNLRRTELYPHKSEDCSNVCKERGCENLRVIDGCWKLCMPHCMMAVSVEVQGQPLLNFPNVCTSEPAPGSVFCSEHLNLLQKHKIPTEKHAFLTYIGCKGNPKSADEIKQVDEKILQLTENLQKEDPGATFMSKTAISYQGTETLVKNINQDLFKDGKEEECNKDTGEKSRLRQRSRGVFVCASGGGNIMCFNPLYKSESPSQVFMLTINMIYQELKDVPEHELDARIESYILSYDNMCHLDSLKAAKEHLPLPHPFQDFWIRIKKIIDRLHLKNHKNKKCQSTYNPDKVLPDGCNTMATEQVFAWMSRFKKIVNSMTQTHHLFYLHRMCKRRNRYTGLCRRRGKEPILPGINTKLENKIM